MFKIIICLFLVFMLFPIHSSFSQQSDTSSTLAVKFTNFAPFQYKTDDGYTVIVGEVENTKEFPLTAMKIWAGFYDDLNEQPLESTIGTTTLDVIPPFGKSPYIIKSQNPNPDITNVSVNLQGFQSGIPKEENLNIELTNLDVGERIKFSGSITNISDANSTNNKIHLAFYDIFSPPRILDVVTIMEEEIESTSSFAFEFDEKYDPNIVELKVFAESDSYFSNIYQIPVEKYIPPQIAINGVSVVDSEGNEAVSTFVGTSIDIGIIASLQNQEPSEQEFVYYAQIKQSGKNALVEYIGKHEGTFSNVEESPSIEWTPNKTGIYYVETFVWDDDGVTIAPKGPIVLLNVN